MNHGGDAHHLTAICPVHFPNQGVPFARAILETIFLDYAYKTAPFQEH